MSLPYFLNSNTSKSNSIISFVGKSWPKAELGEEMEGVVEEDYEGGEDDWFYTMDRTAQASIPKEPSKFDVEVRLHLLTLIYLYDLI